MVRDPSKYADLFKGSFDADKMKGENLLLYILKREKDEMRLTEILSFMNSDRKETLELGELRKKFEVRKLQFEMRMKEAYLTMPFAGQVEFLFPPCGGGKKLYSKRNGSRLCARLAENSRTSLHGGFPSHRLLDKTGSSCRWKPPPVLPWASIRRVLKKRWGKRRANDLFFRVSS